MLMFGGGYVFFMSTDQFVPPIRPIEKPFRCCIADIFKGFHLCGVHIIYVSVIVTVTSMK